MQLSSRSLALKFERVQNVKKKKNHEKELKPALSGTTTLKTNPVQSLKKPLILAPGISSITIFKACRHVYYQLFFKGFSLSLYNFRGRNLETRTKSPPKSRWEVAERERLLCDAQRVTALKSLDALPRVVQTDLKRCSAGKCGKQKFSRQ